MASTGDAPKTSNSPFSDVPARPSRPPIAVSPTPTVIYHGSEEDLTGARGPPPRTDAPRHANGDSVELHYGMSVGEMNSEQLGVYLTGLVPKQYLDNLMKDQVSGRDWAWTINMINDLTAFKAETGVTSAFVMARLIREANEASDADAHDPTRGNVTVPEQRSPITRPSAVLVNKEWERTEKRSPSEPRRTKSDEPSTEADVKAERILQEDTAYPGMTRTNKTERCPTSPDFDNQRKMCTRDEWEDYSQNVSAWLGMYSPRLAHLAEQIKSDPTYDFEDKMQGMNQGETMLDRKWAIALREGDQGLKSRVRAKTKSNVNGRPSGLKMFATLCKLIDAKSPNMVHMLVSKFCAWRSVSDTESMQAEMNDWEVALEKLLDMGVTITDGQKVGSLECMLDTIKDKHTFLAGDLRQILKKNTNDFQGYWNCLEEYLEELEAKHNANLWGHDAEANEVQVDRKTRPCIAFRETGTCSKGSACSWAHIKGTEPCNNEAFVERGFCSAWQTCHGTHPDAMRKGSPANQAKMAKRKAKKASKVKEAAMAAKADDEEADVEAQGMEMLDEGSSDCTSDSESDDNCQQPQPMAMGMESSDEDDHEPEGGQMRQPRAAEMESSENDSDEYDQQRQPGYTDDNLSETESDDSDESKGPQGPAVEANETGSDHTKTDSDSELEREMQAMQVTEQEVGTRQSTRIKKKTAPKVFDDLMEEGIPPEEFEAAYLDSDLEDASIDTSNEEDTVEANLVASEKGVIDSGTFNHVIGTDMVEKCFNRRQCRPLRVRTAGCIVKLAEEGDVMLRDGNVLTGCHVNPNSTSSLFCVKRLARELGWRITTEPWTGDVSITTAGGEKLDTIEDGNLSYLPDSLVPIHPSEWYDKMICMTCAPEEQSERDHASNAHFPARKGCDVCIRAYIQSLGARKGGNQTKSNEVTVSTDLLDWGQKDANGKRYSMVTTVRESQLPTTRALSEKGAPHSRGAMSKEIAWLEAISKPGPNGEPYKVKRMHHDQGSEFKGEFRELMDERGIRTTDGEADRHTDNAVCENTIKMVQRAACAMGIHAIDDAAVAIMLSGEAALWATQLMQTRMITKEQKRMGISAWHEQTGHPSDLHGRDGFGPWGRLAYGYVKKGDRDHKMDELAYRGIWVGFDRDVQGGHRIVPFRENGNGSVTLFKTRVTKTARILDEVFPLRRQARDQEAFAKAEAATTYTLVGESESEIDKAFGKNEAESDTQTGRWVIKALVGHSGDKGPGRQYRVRWENFGEDEDTWHIASELGQAKKMLAEYEKHPKKQVRFDSEGVACGGASLADVWDGEFGGCTSEDACDWIPEDAADLLFEANSVSLTREEAFNTEHAAESTQAAIKEMDQMMQRRLINVVPMTECGWSKERIGKALKCEAIFVKKYSTEQEVRDEGKEAMYVKCRLVGKDLKRRSRKHPDDVYVGVPGHATVRLIVASTDLRTHSISSGDFRSAFCQADDFEDGHLEDLVFWHPVLRVMVVAQTKGPFYGMQVGGHDWKETL
jgi:hypothetical protein